MLPHAGGPASLPAAKGAVPEGGGAGEGKQTMRAGATRRSDHDTIFVSDDAASNHGGLGNLHVSLMILPQFGS